QDVEKAVLLYKDILLKLPEALEALINLRDLYQRHNQADLAVECSLRLGDLYNQQDYVDKAEAEYRNALALAPDHAEAREKLEKLKNEASGFPTAS
ncbi:MAG TPA: tetratricopeptide repeat protein, partial [bacterium]|nr:tetratricopeptide repeat protein [bacterium]